MVSCLWTFILAYFRPIHFGDCSAFDHCIHWIFVAAIHLGETFFGGRGISEVWGKFSPKGAWIEP